MTPEQERLARAMMQEQAQQQAPPTESRVGRNLAAAGELALGALPFTRLGRAMLSTIPRALGTSVGAGAVIEGSRGSLIPEAEAQTRRGDPPSPAVMKLQKEMKDAAIYDGPIDGYIDRGGPTFRAKERWDKLKSDEADQALRAAKTAAEKTAAEAQAAAARAATEETQRLTEEGRRKAQQREAGGVRAREFDESTLAQVLKGTMALGPWVGAGIGYGVGHKAHKALMGRSAAHSTAAANKADQVMGEAVRPADLTGRVGRVNRFWSEGNPQRAEAFNIAPTPAAGSRAPYVPNPTAPAASQLYQPTAASRASEIGALPLAGGIEHIGAEVFVSGPARHELKEAQEAFDRDPTESNLSRLKVAMIRAAGGEAASRLGYGMGAAGLVGAALHGRRGSMARPESLVHAERERGRLVKLLSEPPKPRGPRKPKAKP